MKKKQISALTVKFNEFGWKIALAYFLDLLCSHLSLHKMADMVRNYKHRVILDFLEHKFSSFLKTYNGTPQTETKIPQVIWQCWWQGENQISGIIKVCMESIKRANPSAKIILITKDNYKQFVKLSPKVIHLYETGKIPITALSDYLRVALLTQRGGLWIDVTVFQSKGFDKEIFDYSFYSIKGRNTYGHRYVSYDKWSSWFMAGSANNIVSHFVQSIYEQYYEIYDYAIDYFSIDYMIELGRRNNSKIRDTIDAIPFNNESKYTLQRYLNLPHWKFQFDEETYLYKTNWKIQYQEKTSSDRGEETLFCFLKKTMQV